MYRGGQIRKIKKGGGGCTGEGEKKKYSFVSDKESVADPGGPCNL